MDEPTNHLDIISKDILKKALINFDDALIIVSHDRDFLQGLSNKIYEFKDNSIKEYMGDIANFLASKKLDDLDELNIGNKTIEKNLKEDSLQKIIPKTEELDRRIRKVQNQISRLEKEIMVGISKKKN